MAECLLGCDCMARKRIRLNEKTRSNAYYNFIIMFIAFLYVTSIIVYIYIKGSNEWPDFTNTNKIIYLIGSLLVSGFFLWLTFYTYKFDTYYFEVSIDGIKIHKPHQKVDLKYYEIEKVYFHNYIVRATKSIHSMKLSRLKVTIVSKTTKVEIRFPKYGKEYDSIYLMLRSKVDKTNQIVSGKILDEKAQMDRYRRKFKMK